MGERLCISIIKNSLEIANTHYHWGAYSYDSVHYTKEILDACRRLKGKLTDPVKLCVRALHAGEAGFTDVELSRIERECPALLPLAKQYPLAEEETGLIALSPSGREENSTDVLSTVVINLDTQMVCNDTFWGIDDEEDFVEEGAEDQEMSLEEYRQYMEENCVDLGNIDPCQMRFEDVDAVAEKFLSRPSQADTFFKVNEKFVYATI